MVHGIVWGQRQIYLENPHEKGHRRGHEDFLLVHGQALKAGDVGRWPVLWDQTGHHSSHHQAQDWEGACMKGSVEGWGDTVKPHHTQSYLLVFR